MVLSFSILRLTVVPSDLSFWMYSSFNLPTNVLKLASTLVAFLISCFEVNLVSKILLPVIALEDLHPVATSVIATIKKKMYVFSFI